MLVLPILSSLQIKASSLATYTPVLENLDDLLADLDVIIRWAAAGPHHVRLLTNPNERSLAEAATAAPIPYVKPTVFDKGLYQAENAMVVNVAERSD